MARPAKPILIETDVLPEADRLEGFLHPRETFELFGHSSVETRLIDAYQSGRLHHAWLLTGPEGIGKAVLAYRFARFLLADEGERETQPASDLNISSDSTTARQVIRQAHPNLLVLRRPWVIQNKRFATAIPVDEVRRLRGFLGLTATGGNWRIIIVDSADELNRNAANALLKALEEPPEKSVFFLTSAMAGGLLPTIRSRCQRLELKALGPEDLRAAVASACQAVDREYPASGDFPRFAMLSGGSVRRALELMSGDGLQLYEQLIAILETMPSADYAKVHALADRISSPAAAAQWLMFQSLLDEMLHRFVRLGAEDAGVGDQEAILVKRFGITNHLAEWARLWETITRARAATLALNLDKKNFILEIFQKIESAASLPATR